MALGQRGQPRCFRYRRGTLCAVLWGLLLLGRRTGLHGLGGPQNGKIVGERLVLNDNAVAQKTSQTNIPGFIASADGHWPRLRQR